jgi:hypothetical protein
MQLFTYNVCAFPICRLYPTAYQSTVRQIGSVFHERLGCGFFACVEQLLCNEFKITSYIALPVSIYTSFACFPRLLILFVWSCSSLPYSCSVLFYVKLSV